jgi:NAD-dependent DNA ligase
MKQDKHLPATTGGNLSGQTFLFTGTLKQLKRSEAEEHG